MTANRRTFLKSAAAAAGVAALPPSLAAALARPARAGATGTIADVEHVVILMQENRAFDHYFGMLRGVRGFSDPRAIRLPGGKPVWYQPKTQGDAAAVTPFHLDTKSTSAQTMKSLDHSWKKSHALWKNHDAWIEVKGEMTMGHFDRADIPFYYALADAFTVCDAYHCSIFGPTNPNRLFLFTGTSGLSAGDYDYDAVVFNPPGETNETADPANDTKTFKPFAWTTYAERLQKAGIDWRVYQEYDCYGDNALAYFQQYRGQNADPEFMKRGRSWVAGSQADNAKTTRGEHLVAAFADDVKTGRLPQVSWIVAPYIMCEHPEAPPGYGESLTWRLLEALAANPDVWAKTAFILNYDENDGFFDHVPPLVPAIHPSIGLSSVETKAENYFWEPVGFGPRVPLIVVSPWTRGGFVNSQLHDHTSVLRFLEKRFGVMESNISPWRRAVSGDLTSMFDFAQSEKWPELTGADNAIARTDAQANLPPATRPADARLPVQEKGQRPARPLPYDFDASLTHKPDGLEIAFDNRGQVGAGFILYSARAGEGPWFYTVAAGEKLAQTLPLAGDYDLSLHGANGFYRHFTGAAEDEIEIAPHYDALAEACVLKLRNTGKTRAELSVASGYGRSTPKHYALAPGASAEHREAIAASDHWYDLTVTLGQRPGFRRQLAGHIETGRPSKSDPAIGRS